MITCSFSPRYPPRIRTHSFLSLPAFAGCTGEPHFRAECSSSLNFCRGWTASATQPLACRACAPRLIQLFDWFAFLTRLGTAVPGCLFPVSLPLSINDDNSPPLQVQAGGALKCALRTCISAWHGRQAKRSSKCAVAGDPASESSLTPRGPTNVLD